jgi:NarL family two-component system sensor histidine kinase LiaS
MVSRIAVTHVGLRWRLTLSYLLVTVIAALAMSLAIAIVQTAGGRATGGSPSATDGVVKSSIGHPDAQAIMNSLESMFPGLVQGASVFSRDGSLTSVTGCDQGQAAQLSPSQCQTLGRQTFAGLLADPASASVIHRVEQSGVPGAVVSKMFGPDGFVAAPIATGGKQTSETVVALFNGSPPTGNSPGAWSTFVTQWRSSLSPSWLPLLLGIVIVGTVTGALLSGRLVRRLQVMTATVRTWSRGDLTAAVDPTGRDELAGLATDLNHMAEQLRNLLAARRDIARAEERHNVRRELHDGVKQELFAAALHLAAARASLDPTDTATNAHLVAASRSAHRAQAELTAIMDSQAPPSLAGADLPAAIDALAHDFASATGYPLDVAVPSDLRVGEDTAQTLFRVSQEAITNIRRHAQASTASLTLESTSTGFVLTVVDNGIGLDNDAYRHGFGLTSIRDRVALAGGQLDIGSDPAGTSLIVQLPPDD